MAIIIGDIHADVDKVKAFLAYQPGSEHIVLGDMVDNLKRGVTLDEELECLELIFSSELTLLWGNHDLAYTPERPWRCFTGHMLTHQDVLRYLEQSEYLRDLEQKYGDIFVRDILAERFNTQRERMKAAHAVDGWLCTHAGVSPEIAEIIPVEARAAGPIVIAKWLNEEFLRELRVPVPLTREGPQRYGHGPLFQVEHCRGGGDNFGGIFWFDPFGEIMNPSRLVGRQVFGHTPVPYPDIGATWVNLNTFEQGTWILDTSRNCLVDLESGEEIQLPPQFMD